MADLQQSFDPALAGTPAYGDLAIENGDLTQIDGVGAIAQAAVQNIRTLQGEVFLNLALGVPYYPALLGQRGSLSPFEQAVQDAILTTPGVIAISYWQMQPFPAERRVTVVFRATTTLGPVAWSGTLSP